MISKIFIQTFGTSVKNTGMSHKFSFQDPSSKITQKKTARRILRKPDLRRKRRRKEQRQTLNSLKSQSVEKLGNGIKKQKKTWLILMSFILCKTSGITDGMKNILDQHLLGSRLSREPYRLDEESIY